MAQQSTPSSSVLAKKEALLANRFHPTLGWSTIRHKGYRRIVMPNLCGTRVYLLDPAGRTCNCKAGISGAMCAHRLSLLEALNQDSIAAWIAEQAAPASSRGYASMLPACPCGDLADGADGLCWSCASDKEWEQRRATRRELVAGGR